MSHHRGAFSGGDGQFVSAGVEMDVHAWLQTGEQVWEDREWEGGGGKEVTNHHHSNVEPASFKHIQLAKLLHGKLVTYLFTSRYTSHAIELFN